MVKKTKENIWLLGALNEQNFNEKTYLSKYPDVANAIKNGIVQSGYKHYITTGYSEGRELDIHFNERYYLANNKDVQRAILAGHFECGLHHYLIHGRKEKRAAESPPSKLLCKYFGNVINQPAPLINIITRTSHRPKNFERCRNSVKDQSYKNIRHIVSIDDVDDEYYVKNTGIEYYFIDKTSLPPEQSPNPMEGDIEYGDDFIYNLYINILFSKVEDGFVVVLDDDDFFHSNKSLENVVKKIKTNTDMIIWQLYKNNNIFPKIINVEPQIHQISSQSVMVHHTLAKCVQWDGWRAGDYRYIKRCWLESKNKLFVQQPIITLHESGHGLRIDKIENQPQQQPIITLHESGHGLRIDKIENQPQQQTITAILLNYKRPDNLDPIINSIRSQTVPIKIVLWNNGDDKKFEVDLQINSSANLFCLPRWYLAGLMDSKYVFCIDDDLMLNKNNIISTCINEVEKTNCIIGYAGVILAKNEPYYTKGKHFHAPSNIDVKVDIVKGRFMFIKRELLRNISLMYNHKSTDMKVPEDIYLSLKTNRKHLIPASLKNAFKQLPEFNTGLRYHNDHNKIRNEMVSSMINKRYLKSRNDLLATLPKDLIIAELGVFDGKFSEDIFRICSPKKLILIDKWEGAVHSGDKDGKNTIKYEDMGLVHNSLCKKYANYPNIIIKKGDTVDMLSSFLNNSIDCVYIDADHTYEGVKRDLEISKLKVKTGGFIIGHDYTPRTNGVIKAVDEFCDKFNLRIKYLTEDLCPSYCIVNL